MTNHNHKVFHSTNQKPPFFRVPIWNFSSPPDHQISVYKKKKRKQQKLPSFDDPGKGRRDKEIGILYSCRNGGIEFSFEGTRAMNYSFLLLFRQFRPTVAKQSYLQRYRLGVLKGVGDGGNDREIYVDGNGGSRGNLVHLGQDFAARTYRVPSSEMQRRSILKPVLRAKAIECIPRWSALLVERFLLSF